MAEQTTEIRMYGILHTLRKERGLKPVAHVVIPPEGLIAEDLALELGLPLEKIEGIFINHLVYSIDATVHSGDEIAFIPVGVPGPHRFMLGIKNAGDQK